ncbi:MAG: DUF1707 domain-containing protein [Actinomadura sp.]
MAASLREHCGEGRITVDELHERLEAVYSAKTLGQLQEITSDLPEEDLYQLPVPASQPRSTEPAGARAASLPEGTARTMWAAWASVSGINFMVWLIIVLTTGWVYPWWIWVAGPWGAMLLIGSLLGGRRAG